jgi:mono/diheme cytochrome c family protein
MAGREGPSRFGLLARKAASDAASIPLGLALGSGLRAESPIATGGQGPSVIPRRASAFDASTSRSAALAPGLPSAPGMTSMPFQPLQAGHGSTGTRVGERSSDRTQIDCSPVFRAADPVFLSDPYPLYARLRTEDPIHRSPHGLWVLARYADVAAVLRNPRFGREGFERHFGTGGGSTANGSRNHLADAARLETGGTRQSMLFRDPPHHTRLRDVVSRAFTPRAVEPLRPAGVTRDPLTRGRYLTNAMLCPLCHTPISADDGAYDTRYFLAGGMRVTAYPWGVWYSRNLTPDPETGLGGWSEADIVRAIRTGVTPGGRRLDPMAMPWPWFSRLTDDDARAVAAYLRALPPVRNPVPPAKAVPLAEAVGGKLLALTGVPVAVEFWGGNAAVDPALRDAVPAPLSLRAGATALGWTALGLGAGILFRGARLPRDGRRSRRRRWLVVGACLLAGWATLAVWPPLRWMSPTLTTTWLFRGTPALPADLTGAPRAFAERGEYLVTVAPCGLCHTPAGAFLGFYTHRTLAGGMEGRWRVYGRAVSTNPPRGDRADVGSDAAPGDARRRGRRRAAASLAGDAVGHQLALVDRGPAGHARLPPGAAARAGRGTGPAPRTTARSASRQLLLRRRRAPESLTPPRVLTASPRLLQMRRQQFLRDADRTGN